MAGRAPELDGPVLEAAPLELDGALQRVVREALAQEFRSLQVELLELLRAAPARVGSTSSLGATYPQMGVVPTSHDKQQSVVPTKSTKDEAVPLRCQPLMVSPKAKNITLFGRKQNKMDKYKKWLREADDGYDLPFIDTHTSTVSGPGVVRFETDADTAMDPALRLVAVAGTPRTSLGQTLGRTDALSSDSHSIEPHPLAPADPDVVCKAEEDPRPPADHRNRTDSPQHDALQARLLERRPLRVRLQRWAEELVRDRRFEYVSTVMILASAVHIGLQTDKMASDKVTEPPIGYRVVDTFFLAFFTVELLMRLFAFQLRYFTMPGWNWNVLDFVLIVGQLVDEVITSTVRQNTGGFSASLLRVVRLLRAARVFRVMHAVHMIEELRFLVVCVLHSCRSFHWAAALIGMMVYVFGVYLTQLASTRMIEDGPNEDLEKWFGSVPRSTLSLFQALTGGVDWDTLATPLIQLSPLLGIVFVMYMAFCIVAVMNVITGTFVQHAMEGAVHVDEVRKVRQASALFATLDVTNSGFITFDELASHMEAPQVKNFFESIDLDFAEAKCLFEMLDADNTGKVDFESFLGGCMRLQGPAKAIDVLLSLRTIKETLDK